MSIIRQQEENAIGDKKSQLEETTADNEETDLHGPDATSQVRNARGIGLGCERKFSRTCAVFVINLNGEEHRYT